MSEDMTYESVRDWHAEAEEANERMLALAARVAELEHQLAQADGNMVALAARNAELARENAAAVKLLDTCLKFFETLDDDYPPALDYAIRHFKRQATGEISWDESSDQTLRRELTEALLGGDA